MTDAAMYRDQAARNAKVAERTQNLRAMERLIISLGGTLSYVRWLEALPEDAKLNAAGSMDQATANAIAANDEAWGKALRTFAAQLGPVLTGLAKEGAYDGQAE